MLFREEKNSNIWRAEQHLFLPESAVEELSEKEIESLSPLELAIVKIGLLPTIVQEEFKNLILTKEQKKFISIFQKQYRHISKWLSCFAFASKSVEDKLKKSDSNGAKIFADYLWKMLQVIEICLQERNLGQNSSPDFPYLLWFDMAHSKFLESLRNGGFIMPLPDDISIPKREYMKIWENDVIPRLNIFENRIKDYFTVSEISSNSDEWEKRVHRIFFDDCLKWAKQNHNYRTMNAIEELLKLEKKMIDKINKRNGSGMYQVLTIHDNGLRTTGRQKPKGFGRKK